jgi:hypothetical protein
MVNLLTVLRWLNAIAKRSNPPSEQLRTCCTFRQRQLDIHVGAVSAVAWSKRRPGKLADYRAALAASRRAFSFMWVEQQCTISRWYRSLQYCEQ